MRQLLLVFSGVILALSFHYGNASTKCVKAIGNFVCEKDPERAIDVQVNMYDRDRLGPDDLMGQAWSGDDGSFEVSGCGYDFGAWNSPEPYLHISHHCHDSDESVWRTTEVAIWQKWLPEVTEVGRILLDNQGHLDD